MMISSLFSPQASSPLTIVDAIRMVDDWTDLTPGSRRELGSALSTLAKLDGSPPDSVLLTVATVRTALNQSARVWRLKTGSQRNVRTRLKFVLARLGLIDATEAPLDPAWTDLLNLLPPLPRGGLVAFGRYCSAQQIAPTAVAAEAALSAFEAYLDARTLCPRPRARVGNLRKIWNQACAKVAGWPPHKLAKMKAPNHFALPISAFSEDFQADLAAFGVRIGRSMLDEAFLSKSDAATALTAAEVALDKPPRPLKPSTVASRLGHARWAASALVASGVPIETITSLADLVMPLERAHTILRFLYQRADGQPSATAMHAGEVLRIIAKYHLKRPDEEVEIIKKFCADVKLSYHGMTDKNEKTIEAMMQPAQERRLLELPEAYMAAARKRLATEPRDAAGLALRALAIEILTTFPFRLANLIGLRFDRHLHRNDPRGPVTGILISAEEVKNTEKIVLPLSPRLGRFIEEWTQRFRGIIAAPGCGYLFPGYGTGDQAMTPQGLRHAIKGAMADYVGVVMTPHQFRHLAAERFLSVYPGQYEALRQLLGHKSVETTRRAYCRKENKTVIRCFDALITDRRATLSRKPALLRLPALGVPKPRTRRGGI